MQATYDHILPIEHHEAIRAVGSPEALEGHLRSSFGRGFVQLKRGVVLREIDGRNALCASGDRAEARTKVVRRKICLGNRHVRHYRKLEIQAA
jgi:hypothetical protein